MRHWSQFSVHACLFACVLMAGCAMLSSGTDVPVSEVVRREQLIFHSDFAIPKYHRLLDELVHLRRDVYGKLDLTASDELISVFLFADAQKYRQFLRAKFPDLPDRRAFFLRSDTQLSVYAHWGDLVAEDLRHETTHGYLHAAIPAISLWLDEGLAEYFEIPRGQRGLHARHLKLLTNAHAAGTWYPNLIRLEQLTDLTQMSQRDYAESWLWVHLLLESTPERLHLLRTQLVQLKENGTALPISIPLRHMDPQLEFAALQHLKILRMSDAQGG